MDRAERAAYILCKLGDAYLWQPRIKWAQQITPGTNLYFRVGRGRRTCHSVRGVAHSITIGTECLAEAMHSLRRASSWLSYDEIKQRGYFNHRIRPAELMVHTLCHEYGHFVQSVLGRRAPGQQHDDVFYAILDRIHSGGHAGALLNQFQKQCQTAGLSLAFEDTTRNLIQGRIGERILARTANHILTGRVIKRNRKSVTVSITHRGGQHKIRVSRCLIEPDSGSTPLEQSEWH